ncbi:MAG: 3-phosphoshikimate 1-carboxyvinyltransferase [Gammaproteobacteria bacterium]|nr:3-phosphoshikimate 1-carboxyvinyltransferase [Gammaproteobacteria bacterium]NNJ49111.1 3-phosphoshikimate 1-carboxyvinyltransferase [Gammaproteobacteria bacterium]
MKYIVQGGSDKSGLKGSIRVPGDKSISHRSIMFGSLAEGTSIISGFLEGEDSLNTLRAFQAMGVNIDGPVDGKVTIEGVGMHGLTAPAGPLYVGNSGTSMRLLAGLLAGQRFDVELSGDTSLSKRPMKRVTDPLAEMGARVDTAEGGKPPLKITGNQSLNSISYQMPMASAQVKSCCLLAGMYAQGKTCVTEPAVTRDHTERMLKAFGCDVEVQDSQACITGPAKLIATDIDVPADISSAAFFMVGASIAEDSDILLQHVGINPTRTGVIDILKLMAADITFSNQQEIGGEPVADIRVKSSSLKGVHIPEELVPLAIDEFPVIFVAAACADGQTIVSGAEELRVKESDRIQVMADGLVALGVDARATDDGMIIQGGSIGAGTVYSHDDHRIAMAFAMAGLRASGEIHIEDCDNVNTSFPGFAELAASCGLSIKVLND